MADALKAKLGIAEALLVSIVPENALLFSVEPVENTQLQRFDLRAEADFVDALSDEELTAAVAHELGHMWIFTHRPYLQTEQGANDIAMRVVSRDALVQLYDKVWKKKGTTGDLAKLLGPQQTTAGLATVAP